MHRFYKYLYWDERIPEKNRDRIRWRLKVAKRDRPCYVLALNEGRDQLDIYNSLVLLQSYFRKSSKFIIGIAADYGGAVEILQKIAQECYEKNGNGDLKGYLAGRDDA